MPKVRSLHIFAISPEMQEGGVKLFLACKLARKLIISFWVYLARHAQSTHQYLCNISRKTWMINLIFCLQINIKVSSNCYYNFMFVWPGIPKLLKTTSLLFLCNILRKNWVMKLIFCTQVSMKTCYELMAWFWLRWSKFPK